MINVQVLAFSGGQRQEEDLTSALVAAVVNARKAAGTYGIETPGALELHAYTFIDLHFTLICEMDEATMTHLTGSRGSVSGMTSAAEDVSSGQTRLAISLTF